MREEEIEAFKSPGQSSRLDDSVNADRQGERTSLLDMDQDGEKEMVIGADGKIITNRGPKQTD